MFKFFKKIRRQLLQSEKFGTYLKYAFGEILLVVIGILLALQINTWSNQRKDQHLGQKYLLALRADAILDVQELDNYLSRANTYLQTVDQLYSKAETGFLLTKSDLDQAGIIRQTFFLGDDTYQEIISNGHLALLPDEVKTKLKSISVLFRKVNKIDDKSADMSNNQHLKVNNYYELRKLNRTNEYEVIANEASNGAIALLAYKNYINLSYDWMKTQGYYYQEIKKEYLELIELIDQKKS